ncbi:TPA: hypothetical protein ACGR4L_004298 [Serratia marcescens]|uniref:hypothetical protein n=1 Tax=Serratia marcescens TaxID=615 RepID=UPI0009517551|nr:hypothetical protein [Serratia marcescens]
MTERFFAAVTGGAGMVSGALPGILLCAVLGGIVRAEMFLPAQPLTFNGRVLVPSCVARLEEDRADFTLPTSGQVPPPHTLWLQLSDCEVAAAGLTLRAPHWPELPVRGSLMDTQTQRRSLGWYYTVGPDLAKVHLSADSPALLNGQGGTTDGRYFALSGTTYWLDVKDAVTLPLTVTAHKVDGRPETDGGVSVAQTFMLTVSYR